MSKPRTWTIYLSDGGRITDQPAVVPNESVRVVEVGLALEALIAEVLSLPEAGHDARLIVALLAGDDTDE